MARLAGVERASACIAVVVCRALWHPAATLAAQISTRTNLTFTTSADTTLRPLRVTLTDAWQLVAVSPEPKDKAQNRAVAWARVRQSPELWSRGDARVAEDQTMGLFNGVLARLRRAIRVGRTRGAARASERA